MTAASAAIAVGVLVALCAIAAAIKMVRSLQRVAASSQQHAESEAFLESIIENIPSVVSVKDAQTLRYVQVNRAGLALFGSERAALIGRANADFVDAASAERLEKLDQRIVREGKPVAFDAVQLPEKFGSRILNTKKIPIASPEGEISHLLEISEDVTDMLEGLREVEAAWDEAKKANEAKSDFLSRMSHELRTPLNAVLGFGQLLEFEDLTAQQSDSVQQILRGGRHLLGLINEVLDISRIESGNLSLSLEPVALEYLIEETLALVRPLADDADIKMPEGIMPDWSAWVRADQQRLRQVLLNLLSNAVKYNEPGGSISIRCAVLHERRLRIAVSDTGRGLGQDQVARLFSPFERAGAEESGIEGTGLGLALSKRLVEAMHGTIGLETQIGIGSTFWIELGLSDPSDVMTSGPVSTMSTERVEHVSRLLHVEDSLEQLRWVEHLLGDRPDIEIISIADAETAVDMAIRFQPDLLLLDLGVTGMDAAELVERLGVEPATRDIVVVTVATNATGLPHVDRHLVRPIDDAALLAAVFDGLAVARAAASAGRSRATDL